MSENTTVIVSKETRDALKEIGRMGESYDDLIRRLVKQHHYIDEFWREQFDEYMEHDVEEAEG